MALRVLMVNKTDLAGGAAIAAMRLHHGMRSCGLDSWLLVDEKKANDPYTISPNGWFTQKRQVLAARLERRAERLLNKVEGHHVLSQGIGTDLLLKYIKELKPDVVHLHWVNRGQLHIKTLKEIKVPIVWTLHDMWPFTGNCHYAGACTNYQVKCGKCPIHGSTRQDDASASVWELKSRSWAGLKKLTFVAPSSWMANLARSSGLVNDLNIRVEKIANGLDTNSFAPIDKAEAKKRLGLPLDKPLLLFGALGALDDQRKGSKYLISALSEYKGWFPEELQLAIFGSDDKKIMPFSFPVHHLGRLTTEDQLRLAYSAADCFVVPSEQDNLPNTAVEAMACGTPVAGFDIGGLPDIVQQGYNGFLAPPFEPEDLAKAIVLTLANGQELSVNARSFAVKEFDAVRQASMYHRLYHELIYS